MRILVVACNDAPFLPVRQEPVGGLGVGSACGVAGAFPLSMSHFTASPRSGAAHPALAQAALEEEA
jgi:hypothetical protein